MIIRSIILMLVMISFNVPLFAQYKTTAHRQLLQGEIPVTGAGSFDKEGATYVLTKDMESLSSAVFLGKNITLDLNGYSIKFGSGNYSNIPNQGFEDGLEHWDISKAAP